MDKHIAANKQLLESFGFVFEDGGSAAYLHWPGKDRDGERCRFLFSFQPFGWWEMWATKDGEAPKTIDQGMHNRIDDTARLCLRAHQLMSVCNIMEETTNATA